MWVWVCGLALFWCVLLLRSCVRERAVSDELAASILDGEVGLRVRGCGCVG